VPTLLNFSLTGQYRKSGASPLCLVSASPNPYNVPPKPRAFLSLVKVRPRIYIFPPLRDSGSTRLTPWFLFLVAGWGVSSPFPPPRPRAWAYAPRFFFFFFCNFPFIIRCFPLNSSTMVPFFERGFQSSLHAVPNRFVHFHERRACSRFLKNWPLSSPLPPHGVVFLCLFVKVPLFHFLPPCGIGACAGFTSPPKQPSRYEPVCFRS